MPRRRVLTHLPALTLFALLAAIGCADEGAVTPTAPKPTTLNPGGASFVYTIEIPTSGLESILKFPAGANGPFVASASFTLPANFNAQSVATDSTGQIYVGGFDASITSGNEILVYPSTATGAPTPTRTITVTNTCNQMSITASSIYCISLSTGIVQYPLASTGTATPTRTIDGSLTQLDTPSINVAFTVDSLGSMYVAQVNNTFSAGTVLQFAPTATGNVAPTRTITFTGIPQGLATDSSQNLYVTENPFNLAAGFSAPGTIAVYGTTGTAITRSITLTGTTSSGVGGLQMDAANNLYALLQIGSISPYSYAIDALPATLSGNVAPIAEMTSPAIVNPSYNIGLH